ncbi:MAG: ecotin [Campylobacter sp.]|nr:ecotin [Campylobacter sp.]
MRVILLSLMIVGMVFSMDISIFPEAKEGFKQHVIELEAKEDESLYKVVVEFGRVLEVDCNARSYIGGNLEEQNLEGYGYPYYEFTLSDSHIISTMMLCPDTLEERFIKFHNTIDIRYNSLLPLIIYTPNDIDVNLKIYKLESESFVK